MMVLYNLFRVLSALWEVQNKTCFTIHFRQYSPKIRGKKEHGILSSHLDKNWSINYKKMKKAALALYLSH